MITVNITINAAPGNDHKKIAALIEKAVMDQINREHRAAALRRGGTFYPNGTHPDFIRAIDERNKRLWP